MHSQQSFHRAHDPVPSSSLYVTFPDLSAGGSKATQPPHPSPLYVQQQYPPDSDAPFEVQRSPPHQYHPHEQPQQGPTHLGNRIPPPALQQPQPRVAAPYPPFPQDHEGRHTTFQVLPHQMSRAPQQHAHIPIDPWVDTFSNHPSAQPTALRGMVSHVTYSLHPQPRRPLTLTHSTHPTPEHSPTTAVPPGHPTFHDQHEEGEIPDHSPRTCSWGGAGSLNPSTGVFSPAPGHSRIRTAQACEKCRARKAKCSGEHPACQRCLARGFVCAYAAERRMRGPNKPKHAHPPLSDAPQQPAAAEGPKPRKRASTMPSAPRRGLQMWPQQQKQKQNPQHEQGVAAAAAAAASPASPASSAGSGSLGYPPMSESEASPMTPHRSLDGRQPHVAGCFLPSPRVHVQDFTPAARHGVLSHINEGNGYEHDGGIITEGAVPGMYGQDIFPDVRIPFESTKDLF
ncbi:hypothetical protein BC826DRAFT_1051992 [Russula brevipes]|nr:hypothetical protein BC826DRAFT_1051992 [Russula brevipes]